MSLDRLNIDSAMRAALTRGGINDVEGILEVDPDKLVVIGGKETATKLIEMAEWLLDSRPTPSSLNPRTDLAALNVDAATRKKLQDGGILDVETVLEVSAGRLAEIVGEHATAFSLTQAVRRLFDEHASPAGAGRQLRKPKK